MAQLSRRRALHLSLLAALLPGLPAAGAELDLVGTWHVLVHYTDDNSSHPEQPRWVDRVWVFQRKGNRLEWVEYPIAVFEDETGRFERRATGQYARTLGAWEPSPDQLQNIRDGVRVNTRGMKRKSLRGSDQRGWNTTDRARAASASVITYQENWSVGGLPDLPVFVQEDVMGSARTDALEGVTRFETTSIEEGGDLLRGRFERDGTRHGSFEMRRAGAVGSLEEKSQQEIQAQGIRRGLQTSQMAREEARKALAEVIEGSGLQLSDEQMDRVTARALEMFLAGASDAEVSSEIGGMVKREFYAWVPRGAEHDDSSRYRFPFDSEVPRKLELGPEGSVAVAPLTDGARAVSTRREARLRNTYLFKMPVGSAVVAARQGKVVQAGGSIVSVLHTDGSFASYWPMGSSAVEVDQEVRPGDRLGTTGKLLQPGVYPAAGTDPLLVFGVFTADEDGDVMSLKVVFDDGSAEGVSLVTGLSYGGKQAARAP